MTDRRRRPYLFYDATVSVCATCLMRVEAKVILQDDRVYLDKWCPRHGREKVLIADDAAYWREARERYLYPAEMPHRFQTPMRWGCPYDCGLCPDHQQHSCLTVVEITDHCNLACPVCYASSGPHRPGYRPLAQVEAMLDAVVRSEGRPDVVQISGGEPTLHPELIPILKAARARPIKHVMINTNGVRLASHPDLARQLADLGPGLEVYLQLDSLRDDVLMQLRGAKLSKVRLRALERLEEVGLSTTLVVTLAQGLNDDEVGDILRFALQYRCVRGVTFQPIQDAGRCEGYDPAVHRLTMSGLRRLIAEQSDVFSLADLLPVPCHPDALIMGYALKVDDQVVPLTRYVDPTRLAEGADATVVFEKLPGVSDAVAGLYSTGLGPEAQATRLGELLCCLPQVEVAGLTYANVFRVMGIRFADAHDFDLRSVKRSCVHFAQPDGTIVPFDTFNLFYRDGARERLAQLRAAVDRSFEGS